MSGASKLPRRVRIGGASAFWGDSVAGPLQLVERASVDYLVFDYLAETTMAILAGARSRNPQLGYATDFVDIVMRRILPKVAEKRIRVLANAGGINPRACGAALEALAKELGVDVKVAVVDGDDLHGRLAELQATELDGRTPSAIPQGYLSANAYLGARPLAYALEKGADIVVTGRCVDSALVLAPLMTEFGWRATEFDKLAAGSLAGHIVECACQATGGLFTDWERVSDWADIGYPIVECQDDGTFIVTRPEGTGGLIDPLVVSEQLLYEIGDPSAYLLPDVTCDFTNVRVEQEGPDRVRVQGARGRAPSARYKFSGTYQEGYRCSGTLIIVGIDAVAKARRTADALLERTRRLLEREGWPDYSNSRVEIIGAETLYGPHSRAQANREVMLRVTVAHASRQALELFAREIAPAGTSWAPGTTLPAGGRPKPSPIIKQFGGLIAKSKVAARVSIGGTEREIVADPHAEQPAEIPASNEVSAIDPERTQLPASTDEENLVSVPLIALACARSGDKGDISNIGVIARRPEFYPIIISQLTADVVKQYFAHLVRGTVRRYLVPGVRACNFVMEQALDGGGTASLRMDPLGKAMAQMLLDIPVSVPPGIASLVGQGEDGAKYNI